ncbi:Signal transduction histidine kinase [Marinobacter sp. es.048]|uniref:cache domain-containing sensor histidine kinase n=1 Tax=Marinobacter sp. es.048 TaxID=1761795 RepID=UPI000B593C2D|nr:ATP-binding protein [Marinobacter sp. es.048]SNC62975.1 Signal transduction histidine kinase [Marinobacter sp. es.048]
MKSLSLGTRIALITILTSAVTVLILLGTAYNELLRDFERVLSQKQSIETRALSDEVNRSLESRVTALQAFAATLTDGEKLINQSRIENLLGRQSSLSDYFQEGLLVFNHNAVAIVENTFVPGRIGTSYADRSHFQRAITEREPVISSPIIGRRTGLPLLSFLAPIESDDGDLLGFAGGIINLEQSDVIPADSANDRNTLFMVLDTERFIQVDSLSSNAPMPELPPPGENLIVDAALSGVTSGVVSDADGQKWIYATEHLQRVGWMFLRAVPYEMATRPAWASFQKFLLISVFATLLLAAAALALTRAATRPLELMSRKMRVMTRDGSISGRVSESGPPEVRNLATAFNTLMNEREGLDRLKDEFVSTVSHELRTPLTSVNGSLQLLRSGAAGELPPKASAMVDVAFRNSEQLQHLISDLLDFNKAVAGRMPIFPEEVSAPKAIADVCESNSVMAKHYRVPLEPDGSEDHRLIADPVRLRQILDNFVSNAIKFSPAGGSVRVWSASSQDGQIRITVADEGDGVPETFEARLFQRFEQAESGTDRARAGTGLGLAITRELARLMGGEVGYYYDNGAHFWVDLPASKSEHSQAGGEHENA